MALTNQTEFLRSEIRRMTGKRYLFLEAALENMSPEVVMEFIRFLRDIQGEIRSARMQGAREPWRG